LKCLNDKPTLNVLEARHRLAPIEGQKENKRKNKGDIKLEAVEKTEEKAIEVCRLCGSKMEKGYLASASTAWSEKKISNWSLRGLWGGELVIGEGFAFGIHNVDAYRCKKCKLIIFGYGEASNSAKEGSNQAPQTPQTPTGSNSR
jgi:hypothetical protein